MTLQYHRTFPNLHKLKKHIQDFLIHSKKICAHEKLSTSLSPFSFSPPKASTTSSPPTGPPPPQPPVTPPPSPLHKPHPGASQPPATSTELPPPQLIFHRDFWKQFRYKRKASHKFSLSQNFSS